MFGKIILPLFGLVAFIWAVASPSEDASMLPREALERALPKLQVAVDPATRMPASMTATTLAFELEDGRLHYEDAGHTIVTRRYVRRTGGSYRELPLPQDVTEAVMALGRAWAEAAKTFPKGWTLYRVVTSDDPRAVASLKPIQEAYATLRSAAAGHGVTYPETWGFIDETKLKLLELRRSLKDAR